MENIIYQDKHIILCLKAPGIDSEGEGMPALLKEQTGAKEIFCVHRLDKAVGGLMVYAKTKAAAGKLSGDIAQRNMEKCYLAVLPGRPEKDSGELRDLLYRDAAKNKSYVVKRPRRGVKEASLEYRLIESREDCSLVYIKLNTGRSHQIRVQFSSRALPLLGDIKYGSKERRCNIALFSHELRFKHPITHEELSFTALPEASFPWDNFGYITNNM